MDKIEHTLLQNDVLSSCWKDRPIIQPDDALVQCIKVLSTIFILLLNVNHGSIILHGDWTLFTMF